MIRLRRVQGGDLLGVGTFGCVFSPSFPAFQFEMDGTTYSVAATDPSNVALKIFKHSDSAKQRFADQFCEIRGESLFTTLDPRGFFHKLFFGGRDATNGRTLPFAVSEIPKKDFEVCLKTHSWAAENFKEDPESKMYKGDDGSIALAVLMPRIRGMEGLDLICRRSSSTNRFVPCTLALFRNLWFSLCLMEGIMIHGDAHAGNVSFTNSLSKMESRSFFIDFGRAVSFEDRVRFPYTLGHLLPLHEISAKENALLWSYSAMNSKEEEIGDFKPIFDLDDSDEIARLWSNLFVTKGSIRVWMGSSNDQYYYLKHNAPKSFRDFKFVTEQLFGEEWLRKCARNLKSVFRRGSESLREDLLRKEDLIVHCRSLCKLGFFSGMDDFSLANESVEFTDDILEPAFERIVRDVVNKDEFIKFHSYVPWLDRMKTSIQEISTPLIQSYLRRKRASKKRKRSRYNDDEDDDEIKSRTFDDDFYERDAMRRRIGGGEGEEDEVFRKLWMSFKVELYLQRRYAVEKMDQLSALSFHPFLPAVPYPRQFFQAMLHVARECPLVFKPEWIATSKLDTIFPHDDFECVTNRPEELYFGGYVLEDGSKCVMIRNVPEAVEADLNKSASIAQKAIDLIIGTLPVREADSKRALTTFLLEDFDRYAEPAGGRSRYFNTPRRVAADVVRFESEVPEMGPIVRTELSEKMDVEMFNIDTDKFLRRHESLAFDGLLSNVIVKRKFGVHRSEEEIERIVRAYREKMLA